MKIVFRILHFLILYFHLITKYIGNRYQGLKNTLRYTMLLLCYFTDERMLKAYTKRMTKELSHSSIVVNKMQTHNRFELIKLGDVLFYLIEAGSNFITIHDITKTLHFNKKNIEMLLRRKYGINYNSNNNSNLK